MGVKIKEKKESAETLAPAKIPYFMLGVISDLIGKFSCKSYEDFELIKGKKEALNKQLQSLAEKAGGDQAKADVIWRTESDLTKTEFAWLEKENFKAMIPELGLKADQIGVLEFWAVKD